MVQKRKISKVEIAITVLCLMLIYASYYGLENIDEYLAMRDFEATCPVVGKIVSAQNDTRHRNRGSFVWFKARDNQDIRCGDSLTAGDKSQVQVTLKDGMGVTLGENSLVTFSDLEGQKMPDFQMGNFTFKVNGSTQVMVDGQLVTLHGDNANVQFVVKKGEKTHMKLLKGTAQVQTSEQGLQALSLNRFDKLKLKDNSFVPPKNVILTDYSKEDKYIWKLYDIYDANGPLLVEKSALPTVVEKPHGVAWSDAFELNSIVDASSDPSFHDKQRIVSNTGGYTFRKLFLGPNYWRVSIDAGKTWSKAEMFNVAAGFSTEAQPKITKFGEQIPLINKKSSIALDVKSPLETIGYAAEASHSPDFKPEETRSFWSPGRKIQLSFYKPGHYYYRFRSVSKDQALSVWSDVQKFNVYVPTVPSAPDLLQLSRRDGVPGETFRFNWDAKGTVTKTSIVDSNGQEVSEEIGAVVRFKAKRTGRYKVIARSYNAFGQAGPASKPFYIRVAPQPNHLMQAMKDSQARKVAQAEAESTLSLDQLQMPTKRNQSFKSSQLSLRGMVWTLQSSDQYYESQTNSVAGGLAARGLKWIDRIGIEGLLKSHVVKMSDTGGTSVQSLDVRLHRRFSLALPVKFAPEVQVSGFVGYGASRNSGANFASEYDLVKFGTSLEFPVGNNWLTGGEVVYGVGADSSNQTEIAGHLDYFTSREWSFGIGYRLYLFEAGSASTAPNGTLPYREGYTEGYSSLNYHF